MRMERTGQVTATVALRVIILDLHALDDLSGDTAPYQPVRALAKAFGGSGDQPGTVSQHALGGRI
jgi:hypothetical protein